ncbi:histone-lysine N-methyltransferase SETMAR isoform X2 [Pungitius pungitius]|uniref:histone-lysine N-methyltransferase SETMAR isoform X2 n=1 Tax=Pungitius pungitius TaxID=134920 RepID=UPI002E0DC153
MSVDLSNGIENVPVLITPNSAVMTFPEFQYSPDNIQGPGCTTDPSEVTLPGCSCRFASCRPENCSCLRAYGVAYDGAGALLARGPAASGYCSPVFECNALCACSDACSSRVVQGGLRLRLEVYATEGKGWGVRTLEAIPRGTFVCEYAGEVIGPEEARRRQVAQRPGDNNYIIAVREHAGEGSVTETFVDPAAAGNAGRFLNHSCRPNLFMQPVRVHSLVPRLALFAGRDVAAREELTFDYGGRYGSQLPAATQRGGDPQAAGTERLQRKACHCGANNCVRFLPLDLSVIDAN